MQTRHQEETLGTRRRQWWHLPMAVLAAASSLWVASQASADAYQMLGLILLVGTGLYFAAVRGTRVERAEQA